MFYWLLDTAKRGLVFSQTQRTLSTRLLHQQQMQRLGAAIAVDVRSAETSSTHLGGGISCGLRQDVVVRVGVFGACCREA